MIIASKLQFFMKILTMTTFSKKFLKVGRTTSYLWEGFRKR